MDEEELGEGAKASSARGALAFALSVSVLVIVVMVVIGLVTVDHRTTPPEPERPDSHVSATLSRGLVFGEAFMLLSASLIALYLTLENGLRARLAKKSSAGANALVEGRTVLVGRAAALEDKELRVRVVIRQTGENETDEDGKLTGQVWREDHRWTVAEPFALELDSGETVRVDPRGRVLLRDAIDQCTWLHSKLRKRSAAVTPGERVFVVGHLVRTGGNGAHEGAYRGAPAGWVLSAAGSEPLLVSSEPLEQRFSNRCALHGRAAWMFAGLTAGFLYAESSYLRCVFFGRHALLPVTARGKVDAADSESSARYSLTAKTPEGRSITEDVLDATYARFPEGTMAPFVLVPGAPEASQFGDRPTQHLGNLLVASIGVIGALVAYWIYERADRPWYLGSEVIDREPGSVEDSFRAWKNEQNES